MIKEKDYPYFCKPEGKEKFERFIRDFKIYAPSKLPKAEQYQLFRENRDLEARSNHAFDHVSCWMTNAIRRTYYAVSQPYASKEMAVQALQNDMWLRHTAAKYNYRITIFDNDQYNWHNTGCIFILFQLNDPENPLGNNAEVPSLNIEVR